VDVLDADKREHARIRVPARGLGAKTIGTLQYWSACAMCTTPTPFVIPPRDHPHHLRRPSKDRLQEGDWSRREGWSGRRCCEGDRRCTGHRRGRRRRWGTSGRLHRRRLRRCRPRLDRDGRRRGLRWVRRVHVGRHAHLQRKHLHVLLLRLQREQRLPSGRGGSVAVSGVASDSGALAAPRRRLPLRNRGPHRGGGSRGLRHQRVGRLRLRREPVQDPDDLGRS
jgi:hypothetical protein